MFSTLAIVIGPQSVMTALSLAAAAFAAVKLFQKKDSGVEERRDRAIDAVAQLKALGLDPFADLLKVYAVGNYDGLIERFRALFQSVNSEGGLMEMLRKSFFKQLASRLDTEDGQRIIDIVDAFKARKNS